MVGSLLVSQVFAHGVVAAKQAHTNRRGAILGIFKSATEHERVEILVVQSIRDTVARTVNSERTCNFRQAFAFESVSLQTADLQRYH